MTPTELHDELVRLNAQDRPHFFGTAPDPISRIPDETESSDE